MKQILGYGLGVCLLAIGCSAPLEGQANLETDAIAAGKSLKDSGVPFDTQAEAISSSEQCDTVAANRTVYGSPPAYTTVSNYNRAGCVNAYLIDAITYDGFNGVADHIFRNAVTPATSAACQKQRMMAYVWTKNANGTTTYLGAAARWGVWNPANKTCDTAIDIPAQFNIGYSRADAGDGGDAAPPPSYRFALSARTHSVAGNGSSSYTTNPIRSDWR